MSSATQWAPTQRSMSASAPQRCISVVAAGCGWGSTADAKQREAMKALAAETGKMFAEEGIAAAAAKYADAPMRHPQKHKDPRGHAEFSRMLAEHSARRSRADHVQSPAQAADAVRDGGQAAKRSRCRCW